MYAILIWLIFALTALINASLAAAQSSDAPLLTLEEAINEGMQTNQTIRNAGIDIQRGILALEALNTKRYPSFKVSTLVSQPLTRTVFTIEKGQFGTYPGTGPIPAERTMIRSSFSPTIMLTGEIQQPLSQLHQIGLNQKKLALSNEILTEEKKKKQQKLIADIKNAYYQLLQISNTLKAATEMVKLRREIDRITVEFVKEGYSLPPEQMETGTNLARAEHEVNVLKNRASTQKELLANLIGRDVRTDFRVEVPLSDMNIVENDLAAAQKRALAQRPEIRQSMLRTKQADLDIKLKKSELRPEIGLKLSYQSLVNYSTVLPKNMVSIGVSVEWEVFDWGRKKAEVREKQLAAQQAENDVREIENYVVMDVNAKFRQLKEACDSLKVAQLSQKSAYAKYQVAAFQYEQKALVYRDVLSAETIVTQANTEYQNALLAYWSAKAEFEKALGEEK